MPLSCPDDPEGALMPAAGRDQGLYRALDDPEGRPNAPGRDVLGPLDASFGLSGPQRLLARGQPGPRFAGPGRGSLGTQDPARGCFWDLKANQGLYRALGAWPREYSRH